MSWVPVACTLPTAEQPLRVAEFDQLFRTALQSVVRTAPTSLRLLLDGTWAVEATVRDLVVRETECCSFFAFPVDRVDEGRLQVDVVVPPTHIAVLHALAARVGAARGANP